MSSSTKGRQAWRPPRHRTRCWNFSSSRHGSSDELWADKRWDSTSSLAVLSPTAACPTVANSRTRHAYRPASAVHVDVGRARLLRQNPMEPVAHAMLVILTRADRPSRYARCEQPWIRGLHLDHQHYFNGLIVTSILPPPRTWSSTTHGTWQPDSVSTARHDLHSVGPPRVDYIYSVTFCCNAWSDCAQPALANSVGCRCPCRNEWQCMVSR